MKQVKQVYWPSDFLEAWGTKAKKTTGVHAKTCFLALPPSAARPPKHSFPGKVWFLGLGTPGLQQKHLANKNFLTCLTKPYNFIGFGAMDVTKPYKLIGFGTLSMPPTHLDKKR